MFIGQCVQYLLDKVFISLVKNPNVQFVRVRQDFVALAIICPNVFLIPAVPVIPAFGPPWWGVVVREEFFHGSQSDSVSESIHR